MDLFILGVDLWRSKDGGVTWFLGAPPWYENKVHADKHDLVFKKLNSENIKTLESSKRIILDDNSENLKIKKIISNITIKKAKKSINNVKMDLKNYNKMIQNDVRFIENKQNEIREII